MIDVFYPYFETESTWHELRYSLRSIEKHFKFDFRVVIVGDLPCWIDPSSVLYIPHARIEGIHENTLYDAITKQLIFNAHPDTSLNFECRLFGINSDLIDGSKFLIVYGIIGNVSDCSM